MSSAYRYLRDEDGEVWITVCQHETDRYKVVGLAYRSPSDQFHKARGRRIAFGRMLKAILERKHARPINRAFVHGITGLVQIPEGLDINFGYKSQFYEV